MSFQAYPLACATDEALRAAAARWQRRGLLTPAQRAAIEAAHPGQYVRPGIWVRVALLAVTLLGLGAGLVLAVLLTAGRLPATVYGALLLLGTVAALEFAIKSSAHYRSGVDNALLYVAIATWGFLANEISESLVAGPHVLTLWLVLMLVVLLAALLRYADPLVAAASLGTALWLLATTLLYSAVGQLLLPFGLLAAAGALLWALGRLPAYAYYTYYRGAALVLRALGLAVLYLAGNYLMVREGNAALLGGGGVSGQVPLAALFYVFTAVMPLLYIGLGLRRADRLLLTVGLLALAFSLYTLRYYHSLLPPEVAATLGGLLLLAGALGALRYLRTPRHGLTSAADAEASPHFNLENVIIAQTAHVPAAPEVGFEFGGGHSGGGGAEGRF